MAKIFSKPKRSRLKEEIKQRNRDAEINFITSDELNQRIQKKAYEIYEERGWQPGSDWDDWFSAEKIERSRVKFAK